MITPIDASLYHNEAWVRLRMSLPSHYGLFILSGLIVLIRRTRALITRTWTSTYILYCDKVRVQIFYFWNKI